MTLLTAIQSAAKNVGLEPPDAVIGTDEPDTVKLLQFANETGQELARRVDWGGMRKTRNITGTGFDALLNLPSDYARMVEGWGVTYQGMPVRGGLSADEWNSISPVSGEPRYYQAVGEKIGLYPYLNEGDSVSISYISEGWTNSGKTAFEKDNESAVFPERLLELGTTWRFLRHVSADYSDYLAEFEAALQDFARNDGMVRLP